MRNFLILLFAVTTAVTALKFDPCYIAVSREANAKGLCSSVFVTTVTPAIKTIKVFTSSTKTVTSKTKSTTTSTTMLTTTTSTSTTSTSITSSTSTSLSLTTKTTTTTILTVSVTSVVTAFPIALPKRSAGFNYSALLRAPSNTTIAKRQFGFPLGNRPVIPNYASQICGAIGYASACSRIGVQESTITAPTPTTTITVTKKDKTYTTTTQLSTTVVTQVSTLFSTITVNQISTFLTTTITTSTSALNISATGTVTTTTTTTLSFCASTLPTFLARASSGPFTGQYAQIISLDSINYAISFTPDATSASPLSLKAAGQLVTSTGQNLIANIDAAVPAFLLYFNTASYINNRGAVKAVCSIAQATGQLTCSDQTSNMFMICPMLMSAGAGVVISSLAIPGCSVFGFVAVPVCTPLTT